MQKISLLWIHLASLFDAIALCNAIISRKCRDVS